MGRQCESVLGDRARVLGDEVAGKGGLVGEHGEKAIGSEAGLGGDGRGEPDGGLDVNAHVHALGRDEHVIGASGNRLRLPLLSEIGEDEAVVRAGARGGRAGGGEEGEVAGRGGGGDDEECALGRTLQGLHAKGTALRTGVDLRQVPEDVDEEGRGGVGALQGVEEGRGEDEGGRTRTSCLEEEATRRESKRASRKSI